MSKVKQYYTDETEKNVDDILSWDAFSDTEVWYKNVSLFLT